MIIQLNGLEETVLNEHDAPRPFQPKACEHHRQVLFTNGDDHRCGFRLLTHGLPSGLSSDGNDLVAGSLEGARQASAHLTHTENAKLVDGLGTHRGLPAREHRECTTPFPPAYG